MKNFTTCLVAAATIGCAGQNPGEEGEEETGETTQAVSAQSGGIAANLASSSQPLGGYNIDGIEPVTATVFHLHVTAQAKWEATVATGLTWDGDKVRQGQTLDVTRTSAAFGKMKVLWTLTGELRPLDLFGIDIGSIPLSVDVNLCNPSFEDGGATYTCEAESAHIPIHDLWLPGTPYVHMALGIKFKITPAAGQTTRALMLDGEATPSADLGVTAGSETDSLAMPCNKPAGTTVDYVLDPFTWEPLSVEAIQQPKFIIGMHDPFFDIPIDLWSGSFGPAAESSPSFVLEGAGGTLALGELLPNNVNPTIDPMGTFSGQEGSPVSFFASTHSACPISGYVWDFSNGTTSYGPTPQRTFGDDGMFDGQLKVTDVTGLSGTNTFNVSIANRAPVATAGPDTSGAWGRAIALTGQAVDPGTDDQATLVYSWDFGDGTPGAGGANTSHAYAAPGDYIATLRVCDDHVCDTDVTLVHVRKRTTSVAYTGTNVGVFSAQATLAGSIVDEFGQPVVGGTLAFNLAAASAGSAQTNAAGNAARVVDVTLPAGTYPVGVSYAGNGFYDGGSTGELFDVGLMQASLAYTGSVSGGANKTINLSAKLVDSQNRPLANKLVTFQLGTQSAQATTASTGIATVALKLDQKNGQYPLTATYAGDGSQWTGASLSTTFTIGGGK